MMKQALSSILKKLAEDAKKGPFEKQFLKKRTVYKMRVYQQELKNFILSMPQLLDEIHLRMERYDLPDEVKKNYSYLLAYLYNSDEAKKNYSYLLADLSYSDDVIFESRYGFWGYLDDAYLVGLVYQKIDPYVFDSATGLGGRSPLATLVNEWVSLAREVVPIECQRLDKRLEKLLQGEYATFEPTLNTNS
jgi:hypothetical protein